MKTFLKQYPVREWLKALLTKWIFAIPLLAIFFIPTINLLLLFVPYMRYFFLFILIFVTTIMFLTNKVFTNTLKQYRIIDRVNYKKWVFVLTTIESVISLITLIIIYVLLN